MSSWGAQALVSWTSVAAAHGLSSCGSRALEHRLSGCGAQAYLLCGMRDLPGSGIEPVSPALAGSFFTTEPPGKLCYDYVLISDSQQIQFYKYYHYYVSVVLCLLLYRHYVIEHSTTP